jgi:lipopolysaccharide/colanic/teichoic acid biosynthesis glycosyltransferase
MLIRAIDIFFACIGLLVLGLLYPIIGLLIKWDTAGADLLPLQTGGFKWPDL